MNDLFDRVRDYSGLRLHLLFTGLSLFVFGWAWWSASQFVDPGFVAQPSLEEGGSSLMK